MTSSLIQFGEVLGLLECGKGGGDEWNRVAVLDSNVVQAIVNARAK